MSVHNNNLTFRTNCVGLLSCVQSIEDWINTNLKTNLILIKLGNIENRVNLWLNTSDIILEVADEIEMAMSKPDGLRVVKRLKNTLTPLLGSVKKVCDEYVTNHHKTNNQNGIDLFLGKPP